MKRVLLVCFSALAFVLSSCFDENEEQCLTLQFSVHDEYAGDGDFDSRIGNDILLTTFQGGEAVSSTVIPYADIHHGQCTIKKPEGIAEEAMTLVAWGIPRTATGDCYQPVAEGTRFDSYYLESGATTTETTDHVTGSREFHEGYATVEKTTGRVLAKIALSPIDCLIEVQVEGFTPTGTPSVQIEGTAGRANLEGDGVGNDAALQATLEAVPAVNGEYSTGCVSAMPSKEGETVSVKVLDGTGAIAELRAPQDVPVPARPGGYIVFRYNMQAATVSIDVAGWTVTGEVAKL
ncbi:MAG: hypothetical protein LBN24_08700 [Mediterranea sp.]|jgi:hypothetical protein|nr:hypothetical protein [Mediterranea sp.]